MLHDLETVDRFYAFPDAKEMSKKQHQLWQSIRNSDGITQSEVEEPRRDKKEAVQEEEEDELWQEDEQSPTPQENSTASLPLVFYSFKI